MYVTYNNMGKETNNKTDCLMVAGKESAPPTEWKPATSKELQQ